MYDLPEFYLAANPIGRYSIGDRSPGLRRDTDGSLIIVIQHDQPEDPSNWLPAPAAPFRPLMRLYQPRPAVLDGSYKIPPITKAARSTAASSCGVGRDHHCLSLCAQQVSLPVRR